MSRFQPWRDNKGEAIGCCHRETRLFTGGFVAFSVTFPRIHFAHRDCITTHKSITYGGRAGVPVIYTVCQLERKTLIIANFDTKTLDVLPKHYVVVRFVKRYTIKLWASVDLSVGFVVDEVALRQMTHPALRFCPVSIIMPLSITGDMQGVLKKATIIWICVLRTKKRKCLHTNSVIGRFNPASLRWHAIHACHSMPITLNLQAKATCTADTALASWHLYCRQSTELMAPVLLTLHFQLSHIVLLTFCLY